MSEPTIRDGFTELGIFEKDASAWTTSRDLARIFEKRHDVVLRHIDQVVNDGVDDFNRHNFAEVKERDGKGELRRVYRMTRKGFSLVAMGFTGKKAMEWKVRYIEAFENMAELIFARMQSKSGYKEMSSAVFRHIGRGSYVFAEEANRVNSAVLGMKSSEFRKLHGLKSGETPRDAVVKNKLDQLDSAQRLNAHLIRAGVHGDERSRILRVNYADNQERREAV